MTTKRALFSFLQSATSHDQPGKVRYPGVPTVRLFYLDGHPSIHGQQALRVNREGCWLRLAGDAGERPYHIPIGRIRTVAYDADGFLRLRFEPAVGLMATAVFRMEQEGSQEYQQFLHMIVLSA